MASQNATETSPAPGSSLTDGCVIGVDIGGTKVAAGIVDRSTGSISSVTRLPMASRGSPAEGLAAVTLAIDALLSQTRSTCASVHGIGICAPGPLDPNSGVVLNPPNVPCWRNFPLATELQRKYQRTVKVDNDANAAALAETLWGAGRGYRIVFYATLGTGIGTGIVFDGRIYHGRAGAAGEGGHMTIDYAGDVCACGKRGCIEVIAAGPAIARLARTKLGEQRSTHSMILELAGGNVDAVTSEMVGQAHAAGDALATKVLRQIVQYLSVWLGNIIDLLEPDVIIMGGGVAGMLQPFFPEIVRQLPSWCVNQRCHEIPLLAARYGADAGIAGAAALCAGTWQNG
jgi:glucokinase